MTGPRIRAGSAAGLRRAERWILKQAVRAHACQAKGTGSTPGSGRTQQTAMPRAGWEAYPWWSRSCRGLTTTVGISGISSSASPECSRRVKPPMWQGPAARHCRCTFLYQ